MPKPTHADRRRYKRIKVFLDTTLMPDAGKSTKYGANTCDINEGGLRIVSNTPVTTGIDTLTSFMLPDYENMIIAPSEVVWTETHATCYEAGIRFKHINAKDKDAIRDYVKKFDPASL